MRITFKNSNPSHGFTIIEILVVVGIFALLISLGLFMTIDAYRGVSFRSERDTIVSIIERTRSRAMANAFETKWGVCYEDPNYLVFRGGTYVSGASTNERIPANNAVIQNLPVCGVGTPIVFEQLTGKLVPQISPSTNEFTITITETNRTSDIKINNEGRINW